MYRLGHQGLNLALYAPVLGLATVLDYGLLGLVGAVVVFVTASLPDVDVKVPGIAHRGITHTVWAALAVGLLAAVGTWLVTGGTGSVAGTSRIGLAVTAGGSLAFSVLGHVTGDALTPMGIRPFAPLDGREYSLGVCRADSWLGNRLLFGVGVGSVAGVGLLLTSL